MIARSKIALTIIAGLLATLPATAVTAKSLDAKAFTGTWKLDLAKSKFSSAKYTPMGDTRTYSVAGDHITMHSDMVTGAGKPMKWSYSARSDGKSYPVSGNTGADHIMITLSGPREFRSQTMLKGKPASKSSMTASADGKQLRIIRNLSTPEGATNDTIVYDRVK